MKKITPKLFHRCINLMKKSDPQIQEDGFYTLLPHAQQFVDELIAAAETETNQGLKSWLYELLSETASPKAIPIFKTLLEGQEETYKEWAKLGLEKINTKESRTILFKHNQS